jgi:putative transposase
VTRSASYAWVAHTAQGPSQRQQEETGLVAEIRRIHARSGGTYGAPRVTAELGRRGWQVNHKRVERLLRTHGLVGYRPRRRRRLTRQDPAAPPAPDLLGRRFDPDQPDVAWCGDITSIPTDEGWLYLARVIDLASRQLLATPWVPTTTHAWSATRWPPPWPPAAVRACPTRSSTPTAARRANSGGRRNTSIWRCVHGAATRLGRGPGREAADAVAWSAPGRAT